MAIDARDLQPMLVPDAPEEPRLAELRRAFAAEGVGALGFIPLTHHGRILGEFMI